MPLTVQRAARIDQQLRAAGIPIIGVSLVVEDDKQTWAVQYAPSATPAQITQGNGLVAAYADPSPATLLDEEAQFQLNDKAVQAALMALWEAIPAPTMTKAQVKARAIVIFKGL